MGSPNGLMRQGWTRNSMKVGDVVIVEGSRAKDGSNIGNARTVMVDGKRMFAASSQGDHAVTGSRQSRPRSGSIATEGYGCELAWLVGWLSRRPRR